MMIPPLDFVIGRHPTPRSTSHGAGSVGDPKDRNGADNLGYVRWTFSARITAVPTGAAAFEEAFAPSIFLGGAILTGSDADIRCHRFLPRGKFGVVDPFVRGGLEIEDRRAGVLRGA